jgi:hypothetical protein
MTWPPQAGPVLISPLFGLFAQIPGNKRAGRSMSNFLKRKPGKMNLWFWPSSSTS